MIRFWLIISVAVIFVACGQGIDTYILKCDDMKGKLFCEFRSEKFNVKAQYLPLDYVVLQSIRKEEISNNEMDSLRNIYSDFICFNLYLDDYFNIKSNSVLENVSVSQELALENYLMENLILVVGAENIESPGIKVFKTSKQGWSYKANVVFSHRSLDTENILLKLRSLSGEVTTIAQYKKGEIETLKRQFIL